jgi:hypothetical protein
MTYRQLEQHVPILGWLYIISSAFFLMLGLLILAVVAGVGFLAISSDPSVPVIVGIVLLVVGAIMTMIFVPGLLAGWGLLKRKNWGRVLAVIVAMFNFLNFPLGTTLSVYTLYVLLQPDATAYFQGEKAV